MQPISDKEQAQDWADARRCFSHTYHAARVKGHGAGRAPGEPLWLAINSILPWAQNQSPEMLAGMHRVARYIAVRARRKQRRLGFSYFD